MFTFHDTDFHRQLAEERHEELRRAARDARLRRDRRRRERARRRAGPPD